MTVDNASNMLQMHFKSDDQRFRGIAEVRLVCGRVTLKRKQLAASN